MFKFTTATILAAGAAAVSLRTTSPVVYPPEEDPIDWDRIGDDIYGRTDNTFSVLDINKDQAVTITEMSLVVLMAEEMEYIDHDDARYLGWVITNLFFMFDEEITLDEINSAMGYIINYGDADFPYEHILALIEYMEVITLIHGHLLDFIKYDVNEDNYLSPKELYDAGLIKYRMKFDTNRRDMRWDIDEYAEYVGTSIEERTGYREDQLDKYSDTIEEHGWGMGVL